MKNLFFFTLLWLSFSCTLVQKEEAPPPNILWITSEDMTTMLGTYGDPTAHTPHLDSFARHSLQYSRAFATAPVCSPSRSCIITGFYATSLGTQHLRSVLEIPDEIVPFPKYLRGAGYYTTNNAKEDYNFIDTTIWDESSNTAHWRNREEGQPFFSVFNLGLSHQSSIFGSDSVYEARVGEYLPFVKRISPEAVNLPSYYPDSPEIRKLWARYYTNVAIIDYQFQQLIDELKADGLDDETIVFYYADHGTGMPRSKRAAYDSGLKIPLLVHIPEKYAARFNFEPGVTSTMVSFIDFAPTVLEIAGVEQPGHYTGRPFISEKPVEPVEYVFGTSDRVDEGYELSRTVRTEKYRYIRNYLPHLPLLQPNFYTDQSEIMQALETFRGSEELTPAQQTLFAPERKPEELYDTENDPDEVNNLAYDPAYAEVVQRHREMLRQEVLKTYDSGFMPEPEMVRLSEKSTPFDVARDPEIYPLPEILEVCALMLEEEASVEPLIDFMDHENGFVRYWAVIVAEQQQLLDKKVTDKLQELLDDPFATVQVEAAKTLVEWGHQEAVSVIALHLEAEDAPLVLFASRAFQEVADQLDALPAEAQNLYAELDAFTKGGTENWNHFYKLYTYWALSAVFGSS